MRETELEPGFLQAFRVFVATRIVFWAIIGPILVVVQTATSATDSVIGNLTPPNTGRMIAVEALLLLLLMLPQVPRRLGKWYVPVTLIIALVPLLIGYYWWPSENPLQTPFAIFFFVMLVLIAWQYPFHYVMVYVVGLSLYQFWISAPLTDVPVTADVGWLILQAAMMSLVGYIIVTLVSIQRQQREALAQAYARQAADNVRLKRYAATVEELTISRERNRLARELHDTLAHSLSALTVQLEAVRSLWSIDPTAAQAQLARADETARTGLTEARRALQSLRAAPLQELGLILALRELAETAAERAGARLELDLPQQIQDRVSPVVEQGVYRIAQEALENVVRHADARNIVLRLTQRDGTLTLSIKDDGLGAHEAALPPSESIEESRLGIRGMQERASLIGGQLRITSEAGQGTQVQLTVPI